MKYIFAVYDNEEFDLPETDNIVETEFKRDTYTDDDWGFLIQQLNHFVKERQICYRIGIDKLFKKMDDSGLSNKELSNEILYYNKFIKSSNYIESDLSKKFEYRADVNYDGSETQIFKVDL